MAEDSQRQLRGLYKNVKISVKTLDTIIIACKQEQFGIIAKNFALSILYFHFNGGIKGNLYHLGQRKLALLG